MAVELTPNGTRGFEPPKMPHPVIGVFTWLSVAMFHRFGTRMRVQRAPVLLLNTVGAKSGQQRQTMLCWFADGENAWLIVASAGGSAKHPAWYRNLAANPDKVWIEVGKRKIKVRPESLSGAEREAAWQRVVTQSPGYAGYQRKTDRIIPVVRLRLEREK